MMSKRISQISKQDSFTEDGEETIIQNSDTAITTNEYLCNECNASFPENEALLQHRKSMHEENIPNIDQQETEH